MNAFIKGISYYLPINILSNDDLIKIFPNWTVKKIVSKIGISERHISSEEETALDMSVNASLKLFDEYNISPSIIDYVLFCTQSPDYFLPSSSCIIQTKLGIPTSAGALDFNLGCSGFVYGLSLAKGLIYAGIAQNVLFLTGETYSKHIHPQDKGNRAIFGDAATATLVSTEGFIKIEDFTLGTDGKGAENLIIKTGGLRHREKLQDLVFEEGNPISSDFIFMNGSEIFSFTLEVVPELVRNVLIKHNLSLDQVDFFIFHQANKFILEYLRKKLKIDPTKFYLNMDKTGNTVSATIPIALKDCLERGIIKSRDIVMLVSFGVGYSWGATIITL